MWQEFRNRMARFGPVVIMALMVCSVTYGQDVRTNSRPGTDFSKYHTYKWVDEVKGAPPVGIHPDQILDSQIKQAIDSQMAAKGFTKVDGDKADLLLGYEIGLRQEKEWNASRWGGGPGWGGWGPRGMESVSGTANSSTINIGTLVLTAYDPAAKQLVWIAAAQHAIDPPKKQEKNQKNLDKGETPEGLPSWTKVDTSESAESIHALTPARHAIDELRGMHRPRANSFRLCKDANESSDLKEDPDKSSINLQKAMAKLFKNYPPQPKK